MSKLKLYIFFLIFINFSLLTHGAGMAEGDSDREGIGFLSVKKARTTDTSIIDYHANAVLIASDKCIVAQHSFKGDVKSAFVIFHPQARKLLTGLLDASGTGIDLRGAMDNPSLKDRFSTINLSTIVSHPERDLSIITLDRPLVGVSTIPLGLERPRREFSGYMVSYGKCELDGTPIEGFRHRSPMSLK